jgi:hypothetical protein
MAVHDGGLMYNLVGQSSATQDTQKPRRASQKRRRADAGDAESTCPGWLPRRRKPSRPASDDGLSRRQLRRTAASCSERAANQKMQDARGLERAQEGGSTATAPAQATRLPLRCAASCRAQRSIARHCRVPNATTAAALAHGRQRAVGPPARARVAVAHTPLACTPRQSWMAKRRKVHMQSSRPMYENAQ